METATQQETVTFYLSGGQRADGGAYPSSTVFRISGGERIISREGKSFHAPMKEARFHNGSFQTDDPEVIAELRRLGKIDPMLTENYESYASRVMTKEQTNRRLEQKNVALLEENSRLKEKVAAVNKK